MTTGRWWILLLVASPLLLLAASRNPAAKTTTASDAGTAPFVLCEGTYALCTTALCAPIAGQEGLLSCNCSVQTGYSAAQICRPLKETASGKLIESRYHPIKSYVPCPNNRPWANCLNMPCLIDGNNPLQSTATCTCKVASDAGTYVAVTDFPGSAACTTGIISSATVQDVESSTKFLETQPLLPPYVPIKVLSSNPKP